VLDGDHAPPSPKGGQSTPRFLAHVYCGQTAGRMKLLLGMEVGLSPGDCFRWGPSPVPPKRGGAPSPIFGPFLLWPNGSMHQQSCQGLETDQRETSFGGETETPKALRARRRCPAAHWGEVWGENFSIFELKNASFGAFWVPFLQLS